MQGKDKNGQLLRLGDFVKAQIPVKHHPTPLIGLLRSWAASGRILVFMQTMHGIDPYWFAPSEVELVYHPVPDAEPEKPEKKPAKTSKVLA